MSDQAAGLRAWQRQRQRDDGQQRDARPLLILGDPDAATLTHALARLGGDWRPVRLDDALDLLPSHALLLIETMPDDATAAYRWLKRMASDVGPLPTLVWPADVEDPTRRQQRDNLGLAARRFLGVALHSRGDTWHAQEPTGNRRRG
ncbi:hypothetical protein [Salinicola halophilus]|uniref:hypothetical protein n=1 Tax=Salinicola halophilus TaxID=184065 RepID=UPI000DA1E83F|nr:hypothetical protein [Salinicola halophilus]